MKSGSKIGSDKLKQEPRKRLQINNNYRYAPCNGVRYRKESFGGVLMSRTGKEIILESKSSIFFWKQIEKGIKVKDIIESVEETFNVDIRTAERDVKNFLSILQSKGVIT